MSPENLSVVDVASYVSAGALATSKLISACKPLWNRMPKWLAVALPVLVLALPQIAQFFVGVTSTKELFTAFVTSIALLTPGLAEAEERPKSAVPTPPPRIAGVSGGLTTEYPFTNDPVQVDPSPSPEK